MKNIVIFYVFLSSPIHGHHHHHPSSPCFFFFPLFSFSSSFLSFPSSTPYNPPPFHPSTSNFEIYIYIYPVDYLKSKVRFKGGFLFSYLSPLKVRFTRGFCFSYLSPFHFKKLHFLFENLEKKGRKPEEE